MQKFCRWPKVKEYLAATSRAYNAENYPEIAAAFESLVESEGTPPSEPHRNLLAGRALLAKRDRAALPTQKPPVAAPPEPGRSAPDDKGAQAVAIAPDPDVFDVLFG